MSLIEINPKKNTTLSKMLLVLMSALLFLITNITETKVKLFLLSMYGFIKDYLPSHLLQKNDEIVLEKLHSFILLPLQETIFLVGIVFLFYLIYRPVKVLYSEHMGIVLQKNIYILFFSLMALATSIKVQSMGLGYLQISVDPFNQEQGYYYRRILVPALSYFFHLNGLLYHVFFYILVFVLLYLFEVFFKRQSIDLTFWMKLSLYSGGFVVYQFQFPGYTEILVAIFVLLIILLELSLIQKMSITILSLLTHEAATVFMLLPLLVFKTNWKEQLWIGLIFIAYFLLWLLNFGFDFSQAFGVQHKVWGKTSAEWLFEYPDRSFLGILIAYKLVWLIVPLGYYTLLKKHDYKNLLFFSLVLFFPLVQIYLAVDTSRLVAFGFIGMYLLFFYTWNSNFVSKIFLRYLLITNLVIPSFYIGTNTEIQWINGLYKLEYETIMWIINGVSEKI